MPKIKTKSAVKKRFSLTGSNKLKMTQSGKQHFMRRRTKDQIRNLRGTTVPKLRQEIKNIIKFFMPNSK